MTTLTLAYSSVHKKINKKVNSYSIFGINWKMVCIIGFFMVCSLLVLYAFLINELTGGTYLIKSSDKQIDALSQENRKLEASFAKTDFLESVEQRVKELNFEKTTSVKYIQILDASLAKAQ